MRRTPSTALSLSVTPLLRSGTGIGHPYAKPLRQPEQPLWPLLPDFESRGRGSLRLERSANGDPNACGGLSFFGLVESPQRLVDEVLALTLASRSGFENTLSQHASAHLGSLIGAEQSPHVIERLPQEGHGPQVEIYGVSSISSAGLLTATADDPQNRP